ncbi:MAG: IMPACT family protein [Acidovorax sp. 28-64-14]|uniref:IMPACT family protein n=1 Tax=Acidovorax sp. 28-64-14 TaxID=1970310 RepID=UPI000BCF3D4B|nr:YigZ family protein [Acidovorax sp. 28-64-14]OYY83100.1 MAG: IMPACT family protein [Acidovorax sp. 28-64-14]
MSQTLAAPVHSEIIIKKSRFIGCVQPMPDRASAQAHVDALWKQHPGAAHICWALLAGGQSAAVDDGEPGGTAGRPMLDVLRHQDLEGVLATVVRYFGGVKLGAGGLVRAYTDCVAQALLHAPKVQLAQALLHAPKVQLQRMATLQCLVPYALEGLLRREIEAAGAELLGVQHGSLVTLQLRLPQTQASAFVQRINDLGQGRVGWPDQLTGGS